MTKRLHVVTADGIKAPQLYDPITTVVVISQDRFGNKTIASADFKVGEDGVASASVIAEGFDLDKVWRKWVGLAKELAERERAVQAEAPPQSSE